MKWSVIPLCIACMSLHGSEEAGTKGSDKNYWPMFRGHGSSHATSQNLPTHWSDETIAWKTRLEGVGQSSPVAWKNRVFATSVQGDQKETLSVSCHHLNDGKTLWTYQRQASTSSERSDYTSWAAPTPAVDDQHVYAFFEEGDLVALTHQGELVWEVDLRKTYGPFEGNHGLGSSPILTSVGLVLALDHGGQSWMLSLDKQTGALQWKTERESSSAWASPVVVRSGEEEQILISASGSVTAYHSETGAKKWEFKGIIGNNVPSISVQGDWIAIASNRKGHCRVLKVEEGEAKLVWKSKEASSSFGSPLIHEGRVYFVNKTGIVFCHDLETGELLFDYRLPASTWASPLASGSQVWFFTQNGATVVMQAADEVKVIAESNVSLTAKDRIYGYAVVNGYFILRSAQDLVAVKL